MPKNRDSLQYQHNKIGTYKLFNTDRMLYLYIFIFPYFPFNELCIFSSPFRTQSRNKCIQLLNLFSLLFSRTIPRHFFEGEDRAGRRGGWCLSFMTWCFCFVSQNVPLFGFACLLRIRFRIFGSNIAQEILCSLGVLWGGVWWQTVNMIGCLIPWLRWRCHISTP